jgi:hypothetical protein
VNLTGAERRCRPILVAHKQLPLLVDPLRSPTLAPPLRLVRLPGDNAAIQRVARTPCIECDFDWLAKARDECFEQSLECRLYRARLEPKARGTPTHVRRKLLDTQGDVQPDAEHRPPFLWAALDEDAGKLR